MAVASGQGPVSAGSLEQFWYRFRQRKSEQRRLARQRLADLFMRRAWTTWWLWRGGYTRSHPELGREDPQRRWYCILRCGRVGRCQVFQARRKTCRPVPMIFSGRFRPPAAGRSPGFALRSQKAFGGFDAGWSSPVARQAHNLKVAGSNPAPATKSS